jgi:hypothetical protein
MRVKSEDLSEFHLGYKFDSNTDGPPGWNRDPFLLMFVSFGSPSGETLHYALSRNEWSEMAAPTDADRRRMLGLVEEHLVEGDLEAINRGERLQWLDPETPLFIS